MILAPTPRGSPRYDTLGRALRTTDPLGGVIETLYDF